MTTILKKPHEIKEIVENRMKMIEKFYLKQQLKVIKR